MYYGLLDECLSRVLKTLGIEYAVERFDHSRWSIETTESDTNINMGKLMVIVSLNTKKVAASH